MSSKRSFRYSKAWKDRPHVSCAVDPPSLAPDRRVPREYPMDHVKQFYINGQWVDPLTTDTLAVINPATEQPIESIAMGGPDDVDAAVAAAKAAFETFSLTSKDERLALLDSIIGVYAGRMEELADVISQEGGAPLWLAQAAQAAAGLGHLATARGVLADFEFERPMGSTLLVREPI